MKPTGKFLTAVFLVLFIILLVEVGYIYRSFTQPKTTPKDEKLVPTLTLDQTETIETRERNENQAIPEEMIIAMAKANRGILVTSTLHNVYQGTVTEYTRDADGVIIKIAGINGVQNKFVYETDKLSKLSFFRKVGNSLPETITSADVSVGDLVRIEGDLDLLKEMKDSFISDKIIVIKQ